MILKKIRNVYVNEIRLFCNRIIMTNGLIMFSN